ncbi:HCP-like protein [Mytilinidion resinicola]|uniref:HCP-like protein n=1 Tax=Mytilinidion resinicola TaxID=574789 RepID=A0A6A6YBQ8_9PEZI|nr:HCP-like protein [Mytilinidion resinicola]KAF2806251.1 HCP-like protein [Mytilinidion resinicola]
MRSLQLSPKSTTNGREPSDRRAVTPTFNVRRKDVPKTLVEASAQLNSRTRSFPDSPSSSYHNQKSEALPGICVTPIGFSLIQVPSSFPKLSDPAPSNVPPTDEEKGRYIERAREPVLNSDDADTQLAWASDALSWLAVCYALERAVCDTKDPSFKSSVEGSELEVDAKNIIGFLVEQGHPRANFEKGKWLEFGQFGHRIDKRSAFRLYRDALSGGYMRAAYRMGMMYETSNDSTKAIEYYEKGSKEDDAACCYRMAMMAFLGQHGQKVNFPKAILLLKTAALRADENAPQGAFVLGMLQADELPNIRVPELHDQASAREHLEKAAFLGFAKAQLKMGSAYELANLGYPFDPALSMHYYELASHQGEPEADMGISKWCLCGYEDLFETNEEIAFNRAKRAASQDLPTALFAMGYFHEIGIHVDVDLDQAMEWYRKAAKAGNLDATARINAVGLRIQREQHPPRVPGPGPWNRSPSPPYPT